VSLHPDRDRRFSVEAHGWPDKDLLSKADSLLSLPADQLQDKVDNTSVRSGTFQLETDENGKPNRVSLARFGG